MPLFYDVKHTLYMGSGDLPSLVPVFPACNPEADQAQDNLQDG